MNLPPETLAELRAKANAAKDVPAITTTSDDALVIQDGLVAEFTRAVTPSVVLSLLNRIEALEGALGDISTTCETKELRHYSPDDPGLAVKQSKVIETARDIARRAYGGQS